MLAAVSNVIIPPVTFGVLHYKEDITTDKPWPVFQVKDGTLPQRVHQCLTGLSDK